jgi:preprotein translocase subunit SecG
VKSEGCVIVLIAILRYVLLVVEALSAVLLLGVILIQRSKSQGMGLAFGGGMGESLFGSQVGNVLTKATVILAVVFLCNTTVLYIIGAHTRGTGSVMDSVQPAPAPIQQPVPSEMPIDMPVGEDAPMPMGDIPAPATAPVAIPEVPVAPAAPADAEPPSAAAPAAPVEAEPLPAEPAPVTAQ